MRNVFNATFNNALLEFNEEAVLFCQSIPESVAHDYAVDYTRSLQRRARGIETAEPPSPPDLFEPNRHLIRSTLRRMYGKYFPEV